MKLLINKQKKKLYPDSLDSDLNTNEGIIKKADYNRKNMIETHKGVKFLKIKPNFKDLFKKIKRGPQIITLKDAYSIISELGVMQGYKILDCGGGSGALTACFANAVGRKGLVVSVERNKKFKKIIEANMKRFNFKNVKVENLDLKDYKTKAEFDAVNLDVHNPWDYIVKVEGLMKNGACLSVYVPNTTQLTIMNKEAENSNLVLEHVYEIIKREWDVKNQVCHPKFKILGHTGFIMIYRKVNL